MDGLDRHGFTVGSINLTDQQLPRLAMGSSAVAIGGGGRGRRATNNDGPDEIDARVVEVLWMIEDAFRGAL